MDKTISQIGERKAIDDIVAIFRQRKGVIYHDDCGAIPLGKNYLLFCVDMINKNVDYPSFATPEEIGKLAVSNTLSDIAAMGGWPTYIAVCWGIPKDYDYKEIIRMNKGIEEICRQFKTYVVTGDMNTAPELCISITALGTVLQKQILTQQGARPGDLIAVIGNIGKCSSAVLYFENNLKLKEDRTFKRDLIKTQPPLLRGRFLAKSGCVSSCVDLTDGLYWGAWLLKKANNVGVKIYENKLPLSKRVVKVQKTLGVDKETIVTHKEGDFQLLFTIKRSKMSELFRKARGKYKINIIGEIIKEKRLVIEKETGGLKRMHSAGFEHFSKNSLVYKRI